MSKAESKTYILSGQAIVFNEPSNNGFIYKKESFQKGVFEEYQKRIAKNNTPGIFNQSEHDKKTGEIPISKISHKVIGARMEDDGIYVDIELLDTPSGNSIKTFIDAGFNLYGGQAAMGMINSEGVVEEIDSIISYDILSAPSWNKMKPLKVTVECKKKTQKNQKKTHI